MSNPKTAYASRQWRALCEQAYRTYGYICYGCHEPIDPTLPPTHRLGRTVDHLNPVITHGTQLPRLEDVRPMHRACNTSRENDRRRGHTPTPRGQTW
jgi:hypothetical protein